MTAATPRDETRSTTTTAHELGVEEPTTLRAAAFTELALAI